jgi:hypothetical protein
MIATCQLFGIGATVGPIIDGLHNQCLLRYNVAPILLDFPSAVSVSVSSIHPQIHNGLSTVSTPILSSLHYYESHLFASSWIIPPLLGLAYVVLGRILPWIITSILDGIVSTFGAINDATGSNISTDDARNNRSINQKNSVTTRTLGIKAILAVITTGIILSFSQYLMLHPNQRQFGIIDFSSVVFESSEPLEQHLLILLTAAITQWAYFDGTIVSLIVASMAMIGGPLSELPFVAHHIWDYLPEAGDMYVPLQAIERSSIPGQFLHYVLGDDYATLALNGITGPCYFAVTMDAIAIGRFVESLQSTSTLGINGLEITEEIPLNRLFIASSREVPSSTSPLSSMDENSAPVMSSIGPLEPIPIVASESD